VLPAPTPTAGKCCVVVGVNRLEYVDSAGTRRINPFSRRIEPDVVDANDAGKRGDHPAGLRIHHGQSPGLERGREQAMSCFVLCECVDVGVARNFPCRHSPGLLVDHADRS